MKGCRTDEDIKNSMRSYFRKEREKRKQNQNPTASHQVQSNQPQQQLPPQIVYAQQPVQQPIQQQPPIIIQQPAQQQTPVIVQQQPQQPIYQQSQPRVRKSLLSRVVLATALTGVLITGIWLYQGGLDVAVQNWTEIFYTLKNFAQGMMR